MDAACAAAALALENERLQADLRARLEELPASRALILAAGDEERRRLKRNLHDGAAAAGLARSRFNVLTLQQVRAFAERCRRRTGAPHC